MVFSNGKESNDIKPMSSPKTQLRLVIKKLEMQTKELHQFLVSANLKEKDILRYLEEHRGHIAAQVDRLKLLKVCGLFLCKCRGTICYILGLYFI